MKCRTYMDCHAVVFAVFYRARLHYACAEAGKFQHFGKGNFVKLKGVRHNARIGSVNAVHIGINIADACIKPGCNGNGGCIAAAAAQSCYIAAAGNALKTCHYYNIAFVKRFFVRARLLH